jgi:serine/threonine protein kinase
MDQLPQFSAYNILNPIGSGGMATVYLAEHKKLKHHVAIKVLNKEFIFHKHIRSRFIEEAKKMVRMNHPNVVKVTDLIDEQDSVAIVMEYVDGRTLGELCAENTFTNSEIMNYLKQMLQSLSYVHRQGLVHRDIKPSNFILGTDGNLKLTDFGISKSFVGDNEHTQTETSMVLGTPMYMSPEQIRSTKDVTHLTDIYSLGVVLWELVSGKKPYDSATTSVFDLQLKIVQEALPKTHTIWDTIIQKATQKEESNRFRSAEEFLLALEKTFLAIDDKEATVIAEKDVSTKISTPSKTENEYYSKRSKKIFVIISVIIVFIFAFILFFNYLGENGELNSNKELVDVNAYTDTIQSEKAPEKLREQSAKDSSVLISKSNEKNKIKIGDFYQGGIVFKIDMKGEHGLVYYDHFFNGDYTNAKDWSKTLNSNGFDDWRLPSIKELGLVYDEMYSRLKRKTSAIDPYSSVGSLSYVWSSTETYEKVTIVYAGDPDSNGPELHTWVFSFMIKGHGPRAWRKSTVKGEWDAIAVREF